MSHRVIEPEEMDDPNLDPAAHQRALRGLSRLNSLSRSASIVWSAIADLLQPDKPLRVLDLATGGGDVPIALAVRAAGAGLALDIHACDISDVAVTFARQRAAEAKANVTFFQLNALADPIPPGFDVITSSLFLHHLNEDHARHLLHRVAKAVNKRVVVNDLNRSDASLAMVYIASHLVTTCGVVHTDGPRSVRAAFTLDEARHLAEAAGLKNATIVSRFPCRFLLTWNKP
jgi:2-polyprenyl-3-methyl-5-hydroxy-6-metoxy-1,4-benzoquinol methylase